MGTECFCKHFKFTIIFVIETITNKKRKQVKFVRCPKNSNRVRKIASLPAPSPHHSLPLTNPFPLLTPPPHHSPPYQPLPLFNPLPILSRQRVNFYVINITLYLQQNEPVGATAASDTEEDISEMQARLEALRS